MKFNIRHSIEVSELEPDYDAEKNAIKICINAEFDTQAVLELIETLKVAAQLLAKADMRDKQ